MKVATPETGVADSSITTSELLDSTVIGWSEVKARSEFMVTTRAAAPVVRLRAFVLLTRVNALDFNAGSYTLTVTVKSAKPELRLLKVAVVLPVFKPAKVNVALPPIACTWPFPLFDTTVVSATARSIA